MKVLVAEGNIHDSRERSREIAGFTQGERYSDVLQTISPGLQVDIYDVPDSERPPPAPLESYHGVVITGSALNIYEDRPEVLRQIDFARSVFEIGVPFFGSCWGLQIANVAAGGAVHINPRGREIGCARRIRLTDAGSAHPMHKGRAACFDAPAVHTDHVTRPAEGMIVTASNEVSEVQAAEIRHANGVFWGVQYHPEFTIRDLSDVLVRYAKVLVEEECMFANQARLNEYIEELRQLDADRTRRDIAWRFGLDADFLDDRRRNCEIENWLRIQVGAPIATRADDLADFTNYACGREKRERPHGPNNGRHFQASTTPGPSH